MSHTNELQELEHLYQLAMKELNEGKEKLVVWAGGDAPNQQDALIAKFSERFPGIPVELTVDLSKYHDLAVYQQLLDGYLTPDVVMLQTMNDFEDWKAMGVLEPFRPDSFARLKADYSDPDGAYLGMFMFTFLPQYAKEGPSAPPKDYSDFLKAEYKGRLALTPPHDDDAVLYVYDHIIRKYGEDFLTKLADQNPVFVRGTAAPALLVGQDGFWGNLTGYPTHAGQPSISFIPENDFFVSWPQRAAMFKLTRHKAAARLWLAYLTSHEHQSGRGSWSVRDDVDPPQGLKDIEAYPNTNPLSFINWMRDRRRIHDLRVKMEAVFGPVHGQSPLTDQALIKLYYK